MPGFFQSILLHLRDDAYVHVLLNPLPIYGLGLGFVALVAAMIMRNRRAHLTALIIVLIGAASYIPVKYFGDAGYDVIESQISSDQADAWLDAHGQRALRAAPGYYALIALALIALFLPWKWPKTGIYLNSLVLALTLVDLGLGAWIGYAGGQAMHKEFRSGSAMPAEPIGGYDKMR